MKLHQKLVLGLSVLSTVATAQVNTAWQTTSPLIGIGIATTPSFNLHMHGTTDFTFTDKTGTVNYGKTAKIGLTNTTSGSLLSDGGLIRMSDNNFNLINQEAGTFNILSSGGNVQLNNTAGAAFTLSSTRAFVGSTSIGAVYNYAALNIQALNADNGLFIKTTTAGKYGIAVKVAQDVEKALMVYGSSSTNVNFEVLGSGATTIRTSTSDTYGLGIKVVTDADNLIEGYGSNSTTKTFTVQGSGATTIRASGLATDGKIFLVYGTDGLKKLQLTNDGKLRTREVIVDLVAWPDYVFKTSYSLMPLTKVEEYIKINGHLPNVKSASIIENEGLSLGEMNKTLMEKVEELTLYLIEQQKTINNLQNEVLEIKTQIK